MLLASKFAREKFAKFNYAKVKLNFQCVFPFFFRSSPFSLLGPTGYTSRRVEQSGKEAEGKHNIKKVSRALAELNSGIYVVLSSLDALPRKEIAERRRSEWNVLALVTCDCTMFGS